MTCNPLAASNPQPPYSTIQSDVNDGYAFYDALDVNLSHHFDNGVAMLASYTWSHTIDNVDPDVPSQNPNDANLLEMQNEGMRSSISDTALCSAAPIRQCSKSTGWNRNARIWAAVQLRNGLHQ